jgi:hypothetical protein
MGKQEMVGWLVGGVNTWQEFARVSTSGEELAIMHS